MQTTIAPRQDYTVVLTFKHPAWDEREGLRFEVTGRSKREAIRAARWQADHDGHLIGHAVTEYSFRTVDNNQDN